MKYESLCTLQESAMQHASDKTRNKIITEAYDLLVCRISNKLDIVHSRAWDKFPRFYKHEIAAPNTIEEFYTPHCTVKLMVRRMNYSIQLTVTDESFNAGHSIKSTALLRLAFEATQHDKDGFRIQDCLQIVVDNNIGAIYKQKFDERVDRQNLAYFNKKMKIEG